VSPALPGALAAAAVLVLAGLPRPGALRLQAVLATTPSGPRSRLPALPLLAAVPLALVAGPVPVLLALGAVGAGWRWRRDLVRRRVRTAERAGAGEACAVLAAELRAGRDPATALSAAAEVAAGPLQATLLAAGSAARMGDDVAAALLNPPPGQQPSAVPEVQRSLAACWSVCASSGSGLATAVGRLEEGLRAEAAQRRAVAAELAGPRATAALLALLPVVGMAMAAALGADPLEVLLHTRVGQLCLVLGLGLDALGLLWTSRLVDRAGGAA
jgi:tight adherence protein B